MSVKTPTKMNHGSLCCVSDMGYYCCFFSVHSLPVLLTSCSLPEAEKGRCVLLPENGEHWVSPFDDAESGAFTYRTPCSPSKMSETSRLSSFPGREVNCFPASPSIAIPGLMAAHDFSCSSWCWALFVRSASVDPVFSVV